MEVSQNVRPSSLSDARDIGVFARHDLEQVVDEARRGGAACWRSTGDDPHFELTGAAGQPLTLPAGWYFLRVHMVIDDEDPVLPKIYPDYGQGFAETEAIRLEGLAHEKGVNGVLRFLHDVKALRFDPLNRPGEFSLGRVRLTRISRFWAAACMLRAIASQSQSPWRMLRDAARQAWEDRARLRAFGDWLYQWHHGARGADAVGYAAWVERFDTLKSEDLRRLARSAKALPNQPLISLVMPTYNTPKRWLERCIDSVRAQVYPNWELCIADDASTVPHVRRVLQRYAKKDPRIKVVFRETNGHISAASNSALALAKGEWIALLDHDDELHPLALLEVAAAVAANPRWRMLYTDEDKIGTHGQRLDPYFKPDWNPELFLSQNCVCHLGVYEAALVRDIGGFRPGFEGAQDWDLALRATERLDNGQVGHVAKVLYHWRAIKGSTAMAASEKSYAHVAALRAVGEHLARRGQGAHVEEIDGASGYFRIRHPLPTPAPLVSLLIPTRDRVDLLKQCIDSILALTTYPHYEIIVANNGSVELASLAYFEEVQHDPRVRVVPYPYPFNYSAINNFAAKAARGEVLGLVNNDIEVISPDWLDEMVGHALRPDVGVVGAMLYYPDDTVQHAGVVVGVGGVAGHAYVGMPRGYAGSMSRARLAQAMSAVTAACAIVRRSVFEAVGGLDEGLHVAFNDVDFCLRVREQGYRNVWTPFAELYHYESASRGYEDTPEKMARFQREVHFMQHRWGELLDYDPYYNPNLTLTATPFTLASPPRPPRSPGVQRPAPPMMTRRAFLQDP